MVFGCCNVCVEAVLLRLMGWVVGWRRKRIRRAGEVEDGGSEQEEEDDGGASTPLRGSGRRRQARREGSGSEFDASEASEQEDAEEDSEGMEYSGIPVSIPSHPQSLNS